MISKNIQNIINFCDYSIFEIMNSVQYFFGLKIIMTSLNIKKIHNLYYTIPRNLSIDVSYDSESKYNDLNILNYNPLYLYSTSFFYNFSSDDTLISRMLDFKLKLFDYLTEFLKQNYDDVNDYISIDVVDDRVALLNFIKKRYNHINEIIENNIKMMNKEFVIDEDISKLNIYKIIERLNTSLEIVSSCTVDDFYKSDLHYYNLDATEIGKEKLIKSITENIGKEISEYKKTIEIFKSYLE